MAVSNYGSTLSLTGQDNDSVRNTPTATRALMHTHPETVSEVFLTNGAILRQTFIGTSPPRDYFKAPPTTGVKSPEKNEPLTRTISSQSSKGTESLREDLKIDIFSAKERKENDQRDDDIDKERRVKVGSPYMVIKSPEPLEGLNYGSKGVNGDVLTNEDKEELKRKRSEQLKIEKFTSGHRKSPSVCVERGSVHENESETASIVNKESSKEVASLVEGSSTGSELNSQKLIKSSKISVGPSTFGGDTDHWMAVERKRSDTVIDTSLDLEEVNRLNHLRVLTVKDTDDTLSQDSSVLVEVNSEVCFSDLNSVDDILDIPDEQSIISDEDAVPSDAEEGEEVIPSEEDNDSDIHMGESAVDYESAINSAEKENEKLDEISVDNTHLSENEHFSSCASSPAYDQSGFVMFDPIKTPSKLKKSEDPTSPGSELEDTIQKAETKEKSTRNTSDNTSELSFLEEYYASSESDHRIITTSVERSTEIGTPSKVRRQLIRTKKVSSSAENISHTKDDIANAEVDRFGALPETFKQKLGRSSSSGKSGTELPRSPSPLVRPVRTSFASGRALGHRRMSSAPSPVIHKSQESPSSYAESPNPLGSPFIYVKPSTDLQGFRPRSYSQGFSEDFFHGFYMNRQEQLKRMAEKVCQQDRKDIERDDPEEIKVIYCFCF